MIKYNTTERMLLAQVRGARAEAEASCSQLIDIAKTNRAYYFGLLPEVPLEVSSKVTDKTVWNHVEGCLSQVLPIFTSMENKAIQFTPLNQNDVDSADALTHYISDKILFKNDGKAVLETAIREALVNRIAWVKTHWGSKVEVNQIAFHDVNNKQLKRLEKEYDEVIVTSRDEDSRVARLSGVCLNYENVEDLRLENIPLENMLFSADARNLSELTYIGQVSEVLRGELVEMFGEELVDAIGGDGMDVSDHPIIANVDNFQGQVNTSVTDKQLRKYKLTEQYILTSLLNSGKALQWVQVFTVNNEMLEHSVVKGHPFDPIVAVNSSGTLVGRSFPDMLKDIQIHRSSILRASISNALNMAYPRYQAVRNGYEVDSLLNNVPGGVIEVEAMGNVQQFVENAIPSDVYTLYESLNMEAQRITGVSEMNQGLDPNVLKGTNTAATVLAQMNAGTKRVYGYAKNIAEGWKAVMTKAYECIRENSNKIDITNVGGKSYILFGDGFEKRKLAIAPVFGQDANLEKAQLLMSLADRYTVNPALQKSYNSYQMEQMILDALGIQNRHLILTDPADIPVTEEEVYQIQLQRQAADLELQSKAATVKLAMAESQKALMSIPLESQRIAIEQMKVVGEQEKAAEDVVTDRSRVQVEAQKAGLAEREFEQAGEIEASKLNLEMTKLQHIATMDLANQMLKDAELEIERSQRRPALIGE